MISTELFQEFADFVNLAYSPRTNVKSLSQSHKTISSTPQEYLCFSYLMEKLKYNQKPTVVSEKKFKNTPSTTFYRGLKSREHLKQLVCEDEYHYGNGIIADGLYFSLSKAVAERYGSAVLRAKIDNSAVTYDSMEIVQVGHAIDSLIEPESLTQTQMEMYDKVKNLLDNLGPKTQTEKIKNLLCNNPSILSLVLGVDALTVDYNLCVFNRSRILVSEDDYQSIKNIPDQEK